MSEPSDCDTPLKATFKFKLNGETVCVDTVGQAYRFITELSSVEWMEFRSLHHDAVTALRSAAENAMLTVQATDALRALFARANLLIFQSARPRFICVDCCTDRTESPEAIRKALTIGTVIARTKMRNSAASKIMRSIPTFCRTMDHERNTYRSTYAELTSWADGMIRWARSSRAIYLGIDAENILYSRGKFGPAAR